MAKIGGGTLKGLNRVMRNLNREIKKIEGKTLAGLIRAAIHIRRDMENTSPLIPVDTGNLRASFFVVSSRGISQGSSPTFKGKNAGKMRRDHASAVSNETARATSRSLEKPIVTLGFSASYSTYVHESVGRSFRRPQSGAKFFEAAVKRTKGDVLRIIAENARIKK